MIASGPFPQPLTLGLELLPKPAPGQATGENGGNGGAVLAQEIKPGLIIIAQQAQQQRIEQQRRPRQRKNHRNDDRRIQRQPTDGGP